MPMSHSVARMSIVVGIVELVVAGICVIFGIISVTQYSGHPSSSAGLWMLMYGIPGVLSIAAGRSSSTVTMAFALFFNIIATIVTSLATWFCVMFWILLSSDGCSVAYDFDCSALGKVTAIVAVVTIILFILTATSFTGCILGCMGTCCAPVEPVIVTTVPGQQATVVVNSQNTTQYAQTGYHPMVAQNASGSVVRGYTGPPAPAYGVQNTSLVAADDKPLLENMVV